MKDVVGKLLDRACAAGQRVHGAGQITLKPGRINPRRLAEDRRIRARHIQQAGDEMHQLHIRIAARLGRLCRSREGLKAQRIELAYQFLAFDRLGGTLPRHVVAASLPMRPKRRVCQKPEK